MPAYGRSAIALNNIVRNPPSLPVQMFYGSILVAYSFEGFPSGSLEYTGVTITDLPALESAYAVGSTFNIYAIPFRVSSYAYKREGYVVRDSIKFSIYTVSISLEGEYQKAIDAEIKLLPLANSEREVSIGKIASAAKVPYSGPSFSIEIPESADKDYSTTLKSVIESHCRIKGSYISYTKGVELVKLGSGASWNFPENEVINDGQNTLQIAPAYNRALLTGGFTDAEPDETDSPPEFRFTYIEPKVETIVEEDEYPAEPYANSYVLRTLDCCFDLSGPKKVKKVTTQVYDNPESEEVWVYAFVYTAADIYDEGSDTGLFTDKPSAFWKVIDYKKTNYIYESLQPVTLSIYATDPTNPNKKYPVIVHPDYAQFVRVDTFGGNVTFSSTASYNTQIVTTGWKLARFAREGENGVEFDTRDSENPFYEACKFKKITSEEKTAYLLKSTRAQYGDDVGSPFSVEWMDYDSLDPKLKELVDTSKEVNSIGQVAILTPDINYVEPLFISAEATQKSSFAYMANPLAEEDNPKPFLTTGEETYQQISRVIIGANKYKEKLTEFSAQDPGFSVASEQVRFKEVLGRPPEASYRMAKAEQIKPTRSQQEGAAKKIKKYYITSDLNKNVSVGGSLSYPEAKTLNEALTAAKAQLQIAQIQSSQQSKTVSWFYPNIYAGDRVSTGLDRYSNKGSWIVTSTQWKLTYNGKNNKINAPLVTCDGTQLNLGLLANRSVTSEIVEEPFDSESSNGNNGEIDVSFSGGNLTIGSNLINSPNRRRF